MLFDGLAAAFDEFQRSMPRNVPVARLRLERLELGSLWADFMAVAGVAVTLSDFWSVCTEFMQRLSTNLEALLSGRARDVPMANRTLFKALVNPVANDGAIQSSLQLNGSNNNIIIINQSNAATIAAALNQTDFGRARFVPSFSSVEHSPVPPPPPIPVSSAQDALKPDRAILVVVGGSWMARLDQAHGVLYPIEYRLADAVPVPKNPDRKVLVAGALVDNIFYVDRVISEPRS